MAIIFSRRVSRTLKQRYFCLSLLSLETWLTFQTTRSRWFSLTNNALRSWFEEISGKALGTSPSCEETVRPRPFEVVRDNWLIPFHRTVECISCFDEVTLNKVLRAPCKHTYCPSCLAVLVNESIKDESRFPVRCCKKKVPTTRILKRLEDQDVKRNVSAKMREYATPQIERLYCSTKECSTFLGATSSFGFQSVSCPTCQKVSCKWCRRPMHKGSPCVDDDATQELRRAAKKKGWQTCPGCKAVVQRMSGCNSIICRCGINFCYSCGMKMSNCRHERCVNRS